MPHLHHPTSLALGVGLLTVLLAADPAAALDTRSWDQKITNAKSRFQVLKAFNNEAVLDKETQLVWERSPETTASAWNSARFKCTGRTTGDRKGWRLPSVHELASLVDPNAPSAPFLPASHPFSNVEPAGYWSATTFAADPTGAWRVHFANGDLDANTKNTIWGIWCVRGGVPGPDVY